MKRLFIILPVLFVVSFAFIACNEEVKTELAWENGSITYVNDIVWAGETNNTWEKDGGYNVEEVTDYKEVDHTIGDVYCSILTGDEFEVTTATIGDSGSESASLTENAQNQLTIVATAKK